ncbi:copper-translocating P-t [Lepidopterella palustris CBS 459.81]|uniref:Copper-translocating P-t n=1 Tax=Lepidopterella palustris CBS 459.81 TaxID=1314670 RepID=A0A8E2J9H7_9PEZI|nr:copper-translocating P-t [Lepidopterella palustris CBS 459.81]
MPSGNKGCSDGCCQPAATIAQERPLEAVNNVHLAIIESEVSTEEQCSSGGCGGCAKGKPEVKNVAVKDGAQGYSSGRYAGSGTGTAVKHDTFVKAKFDCSDSCCGGSEKQSSAPVETSNADDYGRGYCSCSAEPHAEAAPGDECNNGCCGSAKVAPVDNLNDDCCEEKSTPCCDDNCVERLVTRQCDKNCTKRNGKDESCCSNGTAARKFYRDLLKSLGCLCRTARDRGEPTCCATSPGASLETRRNVRLGRTKKQNGDTRCSSEMLSPSLANRNGRKGDCCDEDPHVRNVLSEKIPNSDVSTIPGVPPINLENGVAETGHVVLSVSGMTCVGCETKLQRSLATIKAVQNLKTSLILCRAEFDLDLRYESVDSVVRQLQRMTEFKYENLKTNGSEIEFCPSDVKNFVQQDFPMGVFSMQIVDKNTVRISYDSSIVGARELVEEKFGSVQPLAPVKPDPSLAAGSRHVRHVGFMTLLSAILTIPVLVLAWAPIHRRPVVYGSVSLALATLVQSVVAGPFYPTALKSLIFARMIEMDLLIVISTSAAYIFSVVAFGYIVMEKPLATGEFFETSTLLVTLIMVGRWVSALARQKAVESVSVRSLQTPTAVLVSENDHRSEREIDARLLQYGDLFRIAPESRIPTDGTVIAGTSEVDESMITGESIPVEKQPGSVIIAGSVNGYGVLTVRLSRLPGNNSISAIASMIDEAKLSKPKIQDVADKVASYFVPTAIALSVLTFIIWIPIGLKVRHYDGSRAVTEALTYGISVIIVSCPCAIGLAVPMVIVIAGGVAAKHGCIFKTATTIEIARKTSHVVFDKTGTLTQGKLSVSMAKFFEDESSTAAAVHALVGKVKHPVSIAVKKYLEDKVRREVEVCNVISHTAKGVEGTVDGKVLKSGNSRWLGLHDHPDVLHFLSQGYTTFCVTIDGNFAAMFGLKDSLRPDAIQTVAELQRRGIEVSIVSGDDYGPVSAVANQLNITSMRSKCTPADKLHFMKELTKDRKKITIFCGDGTNDAAALAQATIGVHMNEGTDVAQSAADVVLVRSSLIDILTLIDLSRASMLRIGFNFAWSFVYNTLAILLASGALVNVRLPPEFAGLGELVSVLPVIAIAMQLRCAKFSQTPTLE